MALPPPPPVLVLTADAVLLLLPAFPVPLPVAFPVSDDVPVTNGVPVSDGVPVSNSVTFPVPDGVTLPELFASLLIDPASELGE